MESNSSRRGTISGLAGIAAGATLPALAAPTGTPGIQYGYAAMTWGKEEKQAIEDISAVGFRGVQFRLEAVAEFQPVQLKEILQQHKLKFVALSSGRSPSIRRPSPSRSLNTYPTQNTSVTPAASISRFSMS